ncbi:MAG: diguanylate cyclase [Acidimicrobiales bacterium]
MLIDFDHFKHLNDSLGHVTGDGVLADGVQAMRRVMRSGDLIARWGGEEFLLLLADADQEVAVGIAERLRRVVEEEVRIGPVSTTLERRRLGRRSRPGWSPCGTESRSRRRSLRPMPRSTGPRRTVGTGWSPRFLPTVVWRPFTSLRAVREVGDDDSARFERDVVRILRGLSPGDVVTYGEVAAEAGHPGAARAVGSLLRRGSAIGPLPWWRVVTAAGRLVPGHEEEQARRLRAEGVVVADERSGLIQPSVRRSFSSVARFHRASSVASGSRSRCGSPARCSALARSSGQRSTVAPSSTRSSPFHRPGRGRRPAPGAHDLGRRPPRPRGPR